MVIKRCLCSLVKINQLPEMTRSTFTLLPLNVFPKMMLHPELVKGMGIKNIGEITPNYMQAIKATGHVKCSGNTIKAAQNLWLHPSPIYRTGMIRFSSQPSVSNHATIVTGCIEQPEYLHRRGLTIRLRCGTKGESCTNGCYT
jgi:hypothetical protein